MSPESSKTGVLMRNVETDLHTENSFPDGGKAGVMAVTSQGMPSLACNHSKLTEAIKGAPLSDSEGS